MNIYEQYADIQTKKKELEIIESSLKQAIIEDMQSRKAVKEETTFGKFSLAARKNWKYSQAVTEIEEKAKILKVEEQEKGVATFEETSYIVFKTK